MMKRAWNATTSVSVPAATSAPLLARAQPQPRPANVIATFPTDESSLGAYRRPAVPFQRPIEISHFSMDEERRCHVNDDRSLAYYHAPALDDPVLCDLTRGYPHLYRERDETVEEHLDALLETVHAARERAQREPNRVHHSTDDVDVITWRGIMTKIMTAPFGRHPEFDKWTVRVQRKGSCLYLEEPGDAAKEDTVTAVNGDATSSMKHKRPATTASNRNDLRLKLLQYQGYRFEAISTLADHPNRTPDLATAATARRDAAVNTNIQYGTVVKTRLGRHTLIMGAEVDCTRDDKVPNDACRNYVELKTQRVLRGEHDRRNFERNKLLRIYVQSFLASVPRVIIGFHDNGQLKEIQEFETLAIPRMVRAQGYWDPNVCLNFADAVLTWLRRVVPVPESSVDENGTTDEQGAPPSEATYLLEYEYPYRELVLRREDEPKSFVPAWFK